ncbi:MAG: hypothetical protein LBD80_03895 [Tannerella sp.]|jgi:hypothetical protein|nr:hypothetical protein [Tannerella sp.]
MKFLATILCIYISVISAMPCCFDNIETDSHEYETEQQTAGNDSHADCSDDACSPFCICNACGGFAVALPLYEYLPEQRFSTCYHHFFPPVYSFLLPERIWQPPRF